MVGNNFTFENIEIKTSEVTEERGGAFEFEVSKKQKKMWLGLKSRKMVNETDTLILCACSGNSTQLLATFQISPPRGVK
jgi:hypothetical protein